MKTGVNTLPKPDLQEKTQARQLVLFINLPDVDPNKISLFLQHALTRSTTLNLKCSALMINPVKDHLDKFNTRDMKKEFSNKNNINAALKLPEKNNIAKDFIKNIVHVESYYEHILILGEMDINYSQKKSMYSISGINHIKELADFIMNISSRYSAQNSFLRVQICHSGTLKIADKSKTFCDLVKPDSSKECHISAPLEWSVIGKNGYAIDCTASSQDFQIIVPFLNTAVLNAWTTIQIDLKFNEYTSKTNKSACKELDTDSLELNKALANLKLCKKSFVEYFEILCVYPKKDDYKLINNYLKDDSLNKGPLNQMSLFSEKMNADSKMTDKIVSIQSNPGKMGY